MPTQRNDGKHIDLWDQCGHDLRPGPMEGKLLRMVESQEQIATSDLVDDLAEQALLEDLLESAKPPARRDTAHLHYLLASPFRYPPLRHGSRFGSRFDPSLFYGSQGLGAMLAESAYYRLVFWTAMADPPPSGRLLTQHMVFGARYRCARGVRLQVPPCADHAAILCHPSSYAPTQALGRRLRDLEVDGISYRSARDPQGGINLGLFHPTTLISRRPLEPQPWLCETRADRVVFSGRPEGAVHTFDAGLFQVQGSLPLPAD